MNGHLKNLQKKLRYFGIVSVPELLKVRIDKEAIGGALGAGVVGYADPALVRYTVPTGIAVVAISYVRRRRQEWDHLKRDSPAALLLAVQRELT